MVFLLGLHELPEQGRGEAALVEHEGELDPPGRLGHLDPGGQPTEAAGTGDPHALIRLHGDPGLFEYLSLEGGRLPQNGARLVLHGAAMARCPQPQALL